MVQHYLKREIRLNLKYAEENLIKAPSCGGRSLQSLDKIQ